MSINILAIVSIGYGYHIGSTIGMTTDAAYDQTLQHVFYLCIIQHSQHSGMALELRTQKTKYLLNDLYRMTYIILNSLFLG